MLNETPTGWLCPAAVKEFSLNDFVIDRAKPHWGFTSYNDFFHRQIKAASRPISAPADPKVVVSANDGNVVSIARDVRRMDRFWLKGEPFSLADMLNRSEYVDRFVGGDVFQSFLSGGNYHRWHAPIQGTVREASVVDGLMFSDAESAGWDPNAVLSEGYYACVNTRGLVFIESDDPKMGMVCVIPVGITEIFVRHHHGQQGAAGRERRRARVFQLRRLEHVPRLPARRHPELHGAGAAAETRHRSVERAAHRSERANRRRPMMAHGSWAAFSNRDHAGPSSRALRGRRDPVLHTAPTAVVKDLLFTGLLIDAVEAHAHGGYASRVSCRDRAGRA